MDVILVFLQVSWRDSGTRLKDQENLLRQVSIPNANNHCVFHHFPGLCSRSFSFFHLSMPLSLHTYVRPGVHASMPPCFHTLSSPCLRSSLRPCLHAFVPACLRAFIPSFLHASMPACIHASVRQCLHFFVPPYLMPPCLRSSMPPRLYTFVPPSLCASVSPCLRATVHPPLHPLYLCSSMPPCLYTLVRLCLHASVPLCHCPPIPPSIYPLVLHPKACIQSWFLVFLQDHFWQRQQLKRTLSESMLLPISFGKPTVRCICKCLRRKKWSLDRWSLVGFHLILLLLCSTPPRRLTSNERCQTL